MGKFQDLTNKRFGRLLVIKRVENKKKHPCWLCRCECGKEVVIIGQSLKSGVTKSCGCLHLDRQKQLKTKHGKSETRLYNIWRQMKSRCFNPKNPKYNNYGGRGITVCDDWKSDFVAFELWAKNNGYNDALTIDRIDVNGNYYPENCRWITIQAQQYNRGNNHYIEFNGEKKTVTQWARALNMPTWRICNRIKRGWPIEKALSQKKYKKNGEIV